MKSCINGASTMNYSLEEDVRSAAGVGFEGIELWTSKVNAYLEHHTLEELNGLLEEHAVKPAALCPYGLVAFGEKVQQNIEQIKGAARRAEALGCPILLVCPDAPPPDLREIEAIKKAGRVARELGKIAADHGTRIAIEPLGRHPFVPGPREALRIVEEADHEQVGIMMDTFHYYKSEVPLRDIAAIPVGLLGIVHINGCEDLPREELTDGHRLWPGEGVIPLQEMLGAIKENGYRGFLSVEIFRREYWERDIEWIVENAKRTLDEVVASL